MNDEKKKPADLKSSQEDTVQALPDLVLDGVVGGAGTISSAQLNQLLNSGSSTTSADGPLQ
jgi:hypothetical protein